MKYLAKITVDYEIEVEDVAGITKEDIENYKTGFNNLYFENLEEIEDVGGLILAELENAIFSNLPASTPHTSKALKIKPKMEVTDMEIKTI